MDVLQKKLGLVKSARSSNYRLTREIVDMIYNKDAFILKITKDNTGHFRPLTVQDLSVKKYGNKPDEWVTFNGCSDIEVCLSNGEIVSSVDIYNGDNLYGYRGDIRFSATIKIPTSRINIFETIIDNAYRDFMENEYEAFLESQKQDWIAQRSNMLIGNC